jgi:hypothetical protein
MTINYTWEFPTLGVTPTLENKTNIVNTVHWILKGTDENNVGGSVYGTVNVPYNSEDNFVIFESLTKEIIENWVVDHLGEESVSSYKSTINSNIEEQITPKSIDLKAPWEI